MDLRSAILNVDIEKKKKKIRALMSFAERYREDPGLQARLKAGETEEALEEIGVSVPPGVEVRFTANTPDTFHFVMPTDPNAEVSDEALGDVSAGCTAGGGKTAASFTWGNGWPMPGDPPTTTGNTGNTAGG